MRKSLVFILILAVLAAAANSVRAEDAAADTESQVKNLLTRELKAFCSKDIEAIMAMISPEPDVVFLDVAPNGRYVGKDQIRQAYLKDFHEFKSATAEIKWAAVSSRGDIAWFAAEISATVDTEHGAIPAPTRWSGVVEKKDGKWLFVQSQLSYVMQNLPKGLAR